MITQLQLQQLEQLRQQIVQHLVILKLACLAYKNSHPTAGERMASAIRKLVDDIGSRPLIDIQNELEPMSYYFTDAAEQYDPQSAQDYRPLVKSLTVPEPILDEKPLHPDPNSFDDWWTGETICKTPYTPNNGFTREGLVLAVLEDATRQKSQQLNRRLDPEVRQIGHELRESIRKELSL